MEKENSKESVVFKSLNTIINSLAVAGIMFLISQSAKNTEDILVIKEKVENDRQEIVNFKTEAKKISNTELNVELIKRDVESISMRVKNIEERFLIKDNY